MSRIVESSTILRDFLRDGPNISDLLHIEVIPLGDRSISRAISKEFLTTFTEKNPAANIVTRDLASDSIPHLDGETINAAYTPEEKRTSQAQATHGLIR